MRGKAKIASIQRKNGEADLTLNKAVLQKKWSLLIRKILKFRVINKCTNMSFSSALDVVNIMIAQTSVFISIQNVILARERDTRVQNALRKSLVSRQLPANLSNLKLRLKKTIALTK